MKRLWLTLLPLLVLMGSQMPAQQFPPGYVDPAPLLAAVAKDLGEANAKCITFSGTGGSSAVGQLFETAPNMDWPDIDSMAGYTRTINWDAMTSKETFERKPGLAPASWKYGMGWQGGHPFAKNAKQTHYTNGRYSWYTDGDGTPPVAINPEDAERYWLDIYQNPVGFVKAARLPGANPRAFWRWDQIEWGRDGNVVPFEVPRNSGGGLRSGSERVYGIVINVLNGKYTMDATLNSMGEIQRIKTTVNWEPMGDFNVEHESTSQKMFGNVKWPVAWHSHQGWDDNWQFFNASTGHNAYGGNFPKVEPNVCSDPVTVPESVKQAQFSVTPTVVKMGNGIYMFGGGWHGANSYMVEFSNFVAVFEAPGNEERSLAVVEQITKLAPGKPIRYLIASHPHHDAIGGIRTYNHYGATIVQHWKNEDLLNRDILMYQVRTVKPDLTSLAPNTEVAEGYNIETIKEHYVITDNTRVLRVYYVQPLNHVAGMLMAHLPNERIAFEADLYDNHEAPLARSLPWMRSFFNQVDRMRLDIGTVAPVHGKPVPWATFVSDFKALEAATAATKK